MHPLKYGEGCTKASRPICSLLREVPAMHHKDDSQLLLVPQSSIEYTQTPLAPATGTKQQRDQERRCRETVQYCFQFRHLPK
jgi:hypothetical protein